VQTKLSSLDRLSIFGDQQIIDGEMAECCISGLWLLHDWLDESHQISQDLHTSTGSYWHAIMHRREPDFSNSKYWFRRVGDHPIFPVLCDAAKTSAAQTGSNQSSCHLASQNDWDPYRFVDLCEAASRGGKDVQLCRNVAQLEWQILFDFCYRAAVS
jgi:hypothetical protein